MIVWVLFRSTIDQLIERVTIQAQLARLLAEGRLQDPRRMPQVELATGHNVIFTPPCSFCRENP